jgi:hypothetical protein
MAIEAGTVQAAKQHLLQVAEGLVPPGTARTDFVQALKVEKDAKERAQLDWGKYSASVIDAAAETPALKLLVTIEGRVTNVRVWLVRHVSGGISTTSVRSVAGRVLPRGDHAAVSGTRGGAGDEGARGHSPGGEWAGVVVAGGGDFGDLRPVDASVAGAV